MMHDTSAFEALAMVSFIAGVVCYAVASLVVRLVWRVIGRATR